MKYKLNILEPWESKTESTVDVSIVKETDVEFLLFSETPIKTEHGKVQYFVSKFKNEEEKKAFKNRIKGVYPIRMVIDKNIQSANSSTPSLSIYRSNFLSGELII